MNIVSMIAIFNIVITVVLTALQPTNIAWVIAALGWTVAFMESRR